MEEEGVDFEDPKINIVRRQEGIAICVHFKPGLNHSHFFSLHFNNFGANGNRMTKSHLLKV